MVGRAVVQQQRVGLRPEALLQGPRQPRLANTRFTGNQYDAPFTSLGLFPPAPQQVEFLVAPQKPRAHGGTSYLEAVLNLAWFDDLAHE